MVKQWWHRPSASGWLLSGRSAIVAYFLLFATAFALLVPPFEAPDEPAHLAYVNFVATRAELPNQYDPQRALPGLFGVIVTEGHQPPLYYALAALLVRLVARDGYVDVVALPNPGHAWNGGSRTDVPLLQHAAGVPFPHASDRFVFLLLRLCSVALGAANVAAVLVLARPLLAGRWQLLPAVFVATLPQFLFMSAAVNNDSLANLLATMCLLQALHLLRAPDRRRDYLLLGILLGLALLTKKTSLFLLPGLALLLGCVAYRRCGRLAWIAVSAAVMLGSALLLSGWFFARNQLLYGDLLGTQMERATLAALVQEKPLTSAYFRTQFVDEFFPSFVGWFGWMQVPLPSAVYWFYGLLLGASAAGVVSAVRAGRFPPAPAALAVVFGLSCFAGIIAYNLTYSQPQGRFLFPVLSLLAVLLAAGLRELLHLQPLRRVAPLVIGSLIAGFVLADVLSIATIVRFYY